MTLDLNPRFDCELAVGPRVGHEGRAEHRLSTVHRLFVGGLATNLFALDTVNEELA